MVCQHHVGRSSVYCRFYEQRSALGLSVLAPLKVHSHLAFIRRSRRASTLRLPSVTPFGVRDSSLPDRLVT
jgi:hypothetical protein